LGRINSIEEFLFHCLKSRPRAGAGRDIFGLAVADLEQFVTLEACLEKAAIK